MAIITVLLCRKNGADDQCFRAQSILHPPCAQNPENWSGQEEDLPSCHSLAHNCRDDNNCRKSLERYEQTCSVDSDSKTCAATYPACRDAMVEILGTDLRTNCACTGTAGDFRELFECIEYQRLFWVNPCVGQYVSQSSILTWQNYQVDIFLCNCWPGLSLLVLTVPNKVFCMQRMRGPNLSANGSVPTFCNTTTVFLPLK